MAKNKQQKKKDREKRVAKKKLATTEKRRAQAKTANEPQKGVPERTKLITAAAVPKPDYVPTSKKSPFTQRRSGG